MMGGAVTIDVAEPMPATARVSRARDDALQTPSQESLQTPILREAFAAAEVSRPALDDALQSPSHEGLQTPLLVVEKESGGICNRAPPRPDRRLPPASDALLDNEGASPARGVEVVRLNSQQQRLLDNMLEGMGWPTDGRSSPSTTTADLDRTQLDASGRQQPDVVSSFERAIFTGQSG